MKVNKTINLIIGLLAFTALVLVIVYFVTPFFEEPGDQVSRENPDKLAETAKNNFNNLESADQDASFSFAIISDSNGGAGNVSQSVDFANAIQEIAGSDNESALVIHAGDMIAGSSSTSRSLASKMWEQFDQTITPLAENGIAFFPSAGNHDASFNYYLPQVYQEFWDNHQNTQDIAVSGFYSSYYSFDYQDSHFVIMHAPKTFIAEQQLAWLEQDIENAQGKHDNIFVVSHIPLTAVSTYHPNDQLTPNDSLKSVLANKITAFFGAHHNLYYDFEADGIRQIGTGRVGSGGNYRFKSQYGQGSQNYNSYLQIKVNGEEVKIEQVIL